MFNIIDDFGFDCYYFDSQEMWGQTVISIASYGADGSWTWDCEAIEV